MADPTTWIVKNKTSRREPKKATGEWASRLELSFSKNASTGKMGWSYREASESTGQFPNYHEGEVKDNAHKQALIDKARKNAQDHKCEFFVAEGWHTTIHENYK